MFISKKRLKKLEREIGELKDRSEERSVYRWLEEGKFFMERRSISCEGLLRKILDHLNLKPKHISASPEHIKLVSVGETKPSKGKGKG